MLAGTNSNDHSIVDYFYSYYNGIEHFCVAMKWPTNN